MLNASNVPHGTLEFDWLGMGAGGWVTGIDVHPDGSIVTRNDTTGAHIWVPGTSTTVGRWRPLFVPDETYPGSEVVYRNPARRTYEVCFGDASNSDVLLAADGGFMKKSTDRGLNWTKLTGYNGGAIDITLTTANNENGRLGGQRLRVSPTNANNIGLCPTTVGLKYSTDGGTTWATNASVTAPTSNIGGTLHFVSDTEVWIVTNGNLVRRSTTGIGGTFSTVASGPSVCSQIASGGGNVYFIGSSTVSDTQLYMYSAGAFTQPSGVTGLSVAVRPNLTSKIVVTTLGGGFYYSTNTGASWTAAVVGHPRVCHDIPYHGRSLADYTSVGQMQYHPTTDRLYLTHGLGVYYMDAPPGASSNPWISMSLGIEQMLPIMTNIAPGGNSCVMAHDKIGFFFNRSNATQQAEKQIPNNIEDIAHGTGADWFIDDEDSWAVAYTYNAQASLTTDAGDTWTDMPTVPTRTAAAGDTQSFFAGEIACGNVGNMVWMSAYSPGGGVSAGAVKYTTDGGVTWNNPTFGASVNMTGAWWHNDFLHYREVLKAYKGSAGTFYLFCNGNQLGDGTHANQVGLWKSTDGGANFSRIRSGHIVGYGTDAYHCKLVLNNNAAGHFFWVTGDENGYPVAPVAARLFFSPNDGTNLYSAADGTGLAGFDSPDSLAIGAKFHTSQTYETLYVVGYRSGVYGTWMCRDFNPSTRAGTWALVEEWVMGKPDCDRNAIAADPTVPGRIFVCPSSGGGGVSRYVDLATGT